MSLLKEVLCLVDETKQSSVTTETSRELFLLQEGFVFHKNMEWMEFKQIMGNLFLTIFVGEEDLQFNVADYTVVNQNFRHKRYVFETEEQFQTQYKLMLKELKQALQIQKKEARFKGMFNKEN